MALSRPALAILGISLNFARTHPKEVVIATAEAIYRAVAGKYHPDKGAEAISVPVGVNLTEMQEARDAVRDNPSACIKEIGQSERTSKEGKLAGELADRVFVLEEAVDTGSQNIVALWDFIARQKLGLKIKEDKMDERVVRYSTLNLDGVAILVAAGELGRGAFYEYLRHYGTWFKRPVVKTQYSKKNPCPPNIPPELILGSSDIGNERGSFYDQSGPHEGLEGFEVLGSYQKAELARARAKKRQAEGKKAGEDAPVVSGKVSFKTDATILDPMVASVLQSSVSIGAVLQVATRDADENARYIEAGVVMAIRVFDQKQRP